MDPVIERASHFTRLGLFLETTRFNGVKLRLVGFRYSDLKYVMTIYFYFLHKRWNLVTNKLILIPL